MTPRTPARTGRVRYDRRERTTMSRETRNRRRIRMNEPIRAVFFLVSPEDDAGLHLRLLGYLATRVDDPTFLDRWMSARDPLELRESLLREERWLTLEYGSGIW